MDCKFINQNDVHERYLLNRLTEIEKSEYLTHLNSCESCKSKLDSEKELVISVRHFAKNEMKSEIVKQIIEIKSRRNDVSWDMILKVAAIFFFLVITPALLFYYQSIEAPKISESTDFDKLLSQQEENEIVKKGQVDYKIKDVVDSKSKRSENISLINPSNGNINSAGRANADQRKGSINISKPMSEKDVLSKNIVNENKKESYITEEKILPSPAQQKSEIPAMENFQKPILVIANADHNNKSKSQNSNRITANSHSLTSEQIEDDKVTEDEFIPTSKSKSNQISEKKISENTIYKLDFNLNNKKFIINLILTDESSKFSSQESFPESFSVIKQKNENADLTMDWIINERIRNINPDDISVYLKENDILYVNILNKKFYQIDLKSDSTKAITIDF